LLLPFGGELLLPRPRLEMTSVFCAVSYTCLLLYALLINSMQIYVYMQIKLMSFLLNACCYLVGLRTCLLTPDICDKIRTIRNVSTVLFLLYPYLSFICLKAMVRGCCAVQRASHRVVSRKLWKLANLWSGRICQWASRAVDVVHILSGNMYYSNNNYNNNNILLFQLRQIAQPHNRLSRSTAIIGLLSRRTATCTCNQ